MTHLCRLDFSSCKLCELKLEVCFMTKAVSNRDICFVKAVLLLCYHGSDVITGPRALITKFCVAWPILPPPPLYKGSSGKQIYQITRLRLRADRAKRIKLFFFVRKIRFREAPAPQHCARQNSNPRGSRGF